MHLAKYTLLTLTTGNSETGLQRLLTATTGSFTEVKIRNLPQSSDPCVFGTLIDEVD
jgi:hypothetical protein